MRLSLAALLAGLGAASCRDAPAPPSDVAPPYDTVSAIPAGPVAGTIGEQPFQLAHARYVVRRQLDRERVDVELWAHVPAEPCAPIEHDGAPMVWIRFARGGEPDARVYRRGSGDGEADFEIHYEKREADGWHGSGKSAVLLSLDAVEPGHRISGALSVCFADGRGSCVAGRFDAQACRDVVSPDVRDLRP